MRVFVLGVLGAAVLAPAAIAADYPYSGIYTLIPPEIGADAGKLQCAYSFFVQSKDGSFIDYHLDLARYRADRTIRYVQWSRGQCVVDETGKVETCTSNFTVQADQQGQSYIDVYKQVRDDLISAAYFDDVDKARAYAATGEGSPTETIGYGVCPDAAKLGKYLTDETSALSSDALNDVIAPTLDDATVAAMKQVLDTINSGDNP